jgi:SPP1 gp7 family putative phage head morphogenesis protein
VLPAGKLIQRALNAQLFGPIGYRFEFRPEQLPVYQADENERATSFAAYVGAGVKPSIAAQILGIDLPEGIDYEDLDPEPQPMQLQPVGMDATSQDDADAQEREAEAARFKRWAAKRKEPDVTAFKSDILSDTDKEALLGHSAAPFGGESIRDWYKAVRLQLDPSDPDAYNTIATEMEAINAKRIEKGLREWLREVFPPGMSEAEIEGWATRLERGRAKFRDVLERVLIDSSDLGVTVAIDQLGSIGFDYTLASAHAREAASRYSYELVGGITDNTRRALQEAVSRYTQNGEPLQSLIDDVRPMFGERRANMIAVTETTRAYANGAQASYQEAGVRMMEIMVTNDDITCQICLDRVEGDKRFIPVDAGDDDKPPFHVNCRCRLAPVANAMEPLQ